MSKVYPLLPRLTVNRQFIREFLSADAPCLALGMVEERKQQCGYWALRPDEGIPPGISNAGFRFGHALLGTAAFEIALFTFEFYGFKAYNAVINPNNPLVRAVLSRMIASGDYYFLAINPDGDVRAFRSEIGQENLAGLKTNLPRMLRSTTSDPSIGKLSPHSRKTQTHQACCWTGSAGIASNILDLTADRLDLNPA